MSNFQIVDDFEHGIPMTDENMAQFGWVKVVRCRDCKHFTGDEIACGAMVLGYDCSLLSAVVEPDGFCAWGELRGDAE